MLKRSTLSEQHTEWQCNVLWLSYKYKCTPRLWQLSHGPNQWPPASFKQFSGTLSCPNYTLKLRALQPFHHINKSQHFSPILPYYIWQGFYAFPIFIHSRPFCTFSPSFYCSLSRPTRLMGNKIGRLKKWIVQNSLALKLLQVGGRGVEPGLVLCVEIGEGRRRRTAVVHSRRWMIVVRCCGARTGSQLIKSRMRVACSWNMPASIRNCSARSRRSSSRTASCTSHCSSASWATCRSGRIRSLSSSLPSMASIKSVISWATSCTFAAFRRFADGGTWSKNNTQLSQMLQWRTQLHLIATDKWK